MIKAMNKIVYSLSLFSVFILLVMLLLLDILPNFYLITVGITLGIFYLILGILSLKLKTKTGLLVVMTVEIFMGIVFLVASEKIYETNDFIETLATPIKEEATYYVIVNKNKSYQKITDLENKSLTPYLVNDPNYEQVLRKLNKKVTATINGYKDLKTTGTSLLTNQTDAIIVSHFNKEQLEKELESFKSTTKVIDTIKIKIAKNKNLSNNINITEDPYSILISGIDTNGPIYNVSRSDVNIVVTVNPKTNEILMTFIPRDYYVTLHGIAGAKDKLTHAGLYGINLSVATIEDLLNIQIDYYIRVNFDTLVNLVDIIGGVDVYSDMNFKTYKGNIKKGMNHLTGEEALAFSRERKYFAEGDRKRGEHQEEVIKAIINKVTSSKIILTNYSAILSSLENTFQTSFQAEEIKKIVKNQIEKMPNWNITSLNLDGTGSSAYTYSIPNENLYVMLPDEETVIKATEAIQNLKKK